MTVREILFGLAFLSVALNTIAANPLPLTTDMKFEIGNVLREGMPKTDLPLVLEDNVFSSAYYDVLEILSSRNRCSEFFGDSTTIGVFNQLVAKMHKDYLPADIGIRMSGKAENIVNPQTNRIYRLFEKVSLNGNGPFYRSRKFNSEPSLPGVGTYGANTREVRVLMLLHELGHTVKTDDGKWLLPDDGQNESLSQRNSMKVEQECGEEIANVGKDAKKAPPQSGKLSTTDEEIK